MHTHTQHKHAVYLKCKDTKYKYMEAGQTIRRPVKVLAANNKFKMDWNKQLQTYHKTQQKAFNQINKFKRTGRKNT